MTTPAFLDKPIFICGHRRSGTTLLQSLLENHPDLLVYPADSGFFYGVYPPYFTKTHSPSRRIRQMVDFCIKNAEDNLKMSLTDDLRGQVPLSIPALRRRFREAAAKTGGTPRDMLRSLMLAYWQVYQRPERPKGWVEKTTSSEIYAADALEWFPEAKFVHVLRDPRDTWASMKSGWEVRFKYHNDAPGRLMQSLIERGRFGFELAGHNLERFGSAVYKVVRYEDLLADTPGVMADVCRFIGVPFSDEVLRPTICGQPWGGNNYGDTKFDGPSRLNAGRWPERIPAEDAALVEYHFSEFMTRYGYPMHFTLADRVTAAVNHYKWYNYAQTYSFTTTQKIKVPLKSAKSSRPKTRARRK